MEKIIEIDLKNKSNLVERYNENNVSEGLIEYIIKQSIYTNKNTKLKIIINKNPDIDKDCIKLIKEGLNAEYKRSVEKRKRNNMKQLIFLLIGMIFIFLATLVNEKEFWKEILIITGWVPIWKMIEIELFPDIYGRRKRRIIKKLLNSDIIVK